MNAPFTPPTMTQPALAVEHYRFDYRAARGFDPVSVAAALLVMAGAFAVLMTMSPSHHHHRRHAPRMVFAMLELPRTPPPPPPRARPRMVAKDPPPVSEVVAPVPHVVTPAPAPAVFVAQAAAPPRVAVAPASPAPVAPPAPSGPADGGDLSSKMISAKPPSYPVDARRAHEQGTVVLTVLLNTTGRVEDISVVHSSGSARLDRAALTAVRGWRWSPLMQDGEAVMVRGMVTIPFVLQA